ATVTINVILRVDWDPFFLAPTILGAIALGLIAITGIRRRRRHIRRWVLWSSVGLGVIAVVSAGLMGVAGLQARSTATDGYQQLIDGLELVENGDTSAASATLYAAAV